jgi:inorganic phosphate transporter, PiT family
MWALVAGVFMGWAQGSNDAASLFGPAVETQALRFRQAAWLVAFFAVLGAVMVGTRGFATYGAIGSQTLLTSFTTMLAAGVTVAMMTGLRLPVSGTQAVVGAIVGGAILTGGAHFAPLVKIFVSWVLTPLGGLVAAYIPYRLISLHPRTLLGRLSSRERFVRVGLVLVTAYAAYSYGGNNVANITGVFVKAGLLAPLPAALIGSGALVLGMHTLGGRVIRTVGSAIVTLNPFAALVIVLAQAVTLNVYALLGVPVSISQAVIGAIVGIGLVKGARTIDRRVLLRVAFGWIGTPAIACAISLGFAALARMAS